MSIIIQVILPEKDNASPNDVKGAFTEYLKAKN